MNERIKELLEQAGVHYVVMPKDTVYEKFAELIVQECVNVLHDNELYTRQVSHVLREHFGIK